MVAQSDLPSLIRRRYAAAGAAEWRTVLTEFGVTDAMSVKLDDRWGHGVPRVVALFGKVLARRARPVGDVGPGRDTAASDARGPLVHGPRRAPPRLESGVVLVDDDLEVRSVTSGAA